MFINWIRTDWRLISIHFEAVFQLVYLSNTSTELIMGIFCRIYIFLDQSPTSLIEWIHFSAVRFVYNLKRILLNMVISLFNTRFIWIEELSSILLSPTTIVQCVEALNTMMVQYEPTVVWNNGRREQENAQNPVRTEFTIMHHRCARKIIGLNALVSSNRLGTLSVVCKETLNFGFPRKKNEILWNFGNW